MRIAIKNLIPIYFEPQEVEHSEIYLNESLYFETPNRYLISAHSGKGKSSFLNFIYGTNKMYEGDINIGKLSPQEIKLNMISYVYQDLKLFEEISLLQNIKLKNELTQHKSKKQIKQYLEHLNLWHKKDELVRNLSFGQRQRVAIIRALCQPFNFLLLDEPFSHLDDENIALSWTLIDQELITNNAGLIMVSLGNTYKISFDKILSL